MKNIKMKTIMKNMSLISGDTLFKRHVYLAYQWIKNKDLTKAENPEYTRKSIRLHLLHFIIKFLTNTQDGKQLFSDLEKHLIEKNFKFKARKNGSDPAYEVYTSLMKEPILDNYYYCCLHQNFQKFYELNIQRVVRLLFRQTPINPEINVYDKYFTLNFKSKKNSSLLLKINNNYTTKDLVEYNFTLIDQIQSQGIFKFNHIGFCLINNDLFDTMIKLLLKDC